MSLLCNISNYDLGKKNIRLYLPKVFRVRIPIDIMSNIWYIINSVQSNTNLQYIQLYIRIISDSLTLTRRLFHSQLSIMKLIFSNKLY